jgi:hypothetical protein
MVLVSYSGREINAKIVYYGPGLSGKTTNLEAIFASIPETHKGRMVSVKTRTERTLFFDFLPVNLGELAGFKTRFLLYTVPGQVYYNATRKMVLKGVDAVVFVADSQPDKMEENKESLENLRENLREQGLSLEDIPWVIQYNKRDLPGAVPIEQMEAELNPQRVPSFPAVATRGEGVLETFRAISRLLLKHLAKEIGVQVVTPPKGAEGPLAPAAEEPAAAASPEGAEAAREAPSSQAPETPSPGAATAPAESRPEAEREAGGSAAPQELPEAKSPAPSGGLAARLRRWFRRGEPEEAPAAPQPAPEIPAAEPADRRPEGAPESPSEAEETPVRPRVASLRVEASERRAGEAPEETVDSSESAAEELATAAQRAPVPETSSSSREAPGEIPEAAAAEPMELVVPVLVPRMDPQRPLVLKLLLRFTEERASEDTSQLDPGENRGVESG